MYRSTFRISCLNAATGAVTRPSERIDPVYAGMRPTAHLPTFGPLQKDALLQKHPSRQVRLDREKTPSSQFLCREHREIRKLPTTFLKEKRSLEERFRPVRLLRQLLPASL